MTGLQRLGTGIDARSAAGEFGCAVIHGRGSGAQRCGGINECRAAVGQFLGRNPQADPYPYSGRRLLWTASGFNVRRPLSSWSMPSSVFAVSSPTPSSSVEMPVCSWEAAVLNLSVACWSFVSEALRLVKSSLALIWFRPYLYAGQCGNGCIDIVIQAGQLPGRLHRVKWRSWKSG